MKAIKNWLLVISLMILGVGMSAQARLFGLGGTSWKEEVLLHDGSKIVVDRSQTYGGRHEIGQSAPIKRHTLSFTLPHSTKTLTFKSEYSEDVGRANLNLLALHVLNGTPYIVAEPNLCLAYNKWGRPNPPYVIFKHDGRTWQRIPLSQLPAEFKAINLIVNNGREEDIERATAVSGYVSVADVQELNSSLMQPEYKGILRVALPGIDCPIPSTAEAKLIAPEIHGKPLYYNWWPLAKDWLDRTYRKNNP